MNNYQLDPCHYFTAPGLAWDASLKMTGIKLELLTDYDMHLFIEKGLRGGNSMIAHRSLALEATISWLAPMPPSNW